MNARPTTPEEIAAEARRLDRIHRSGGTDRKWSSDLRRFEQRFVDAARGDGGVQDIDLALAYLRADPWCHRSGYTAAKVLRGVAHARLTADQTEIAKGYVLLRAREPRSGLLKHTALLGASVWDDELASRMDVQAEGAEPGVVRSTRWLRAAIEVRRPVFGR